MSEEFPKPLTDEVLQVAILAGIHIVIGFSWGTLYACLASRRRWSG